jgi:hypothetical protein
MERPGVLPWRYWITERWRAGQYGRPSPGPMFPMWDLAQASVPSKNGRGPKIYGP